MPPWIPTIQSNRTRRKRRGDEPTRDFVGAVDVTRVEGFYRRPDLTYGAEMVSKHVAADLAPHWIDPRAATGKGKSKASGKGRSIVASTDMPILGKGGAAPSIGGGGGGRRAGGGGRRGRTSKGKGGGRKGGGRRGRKSPAPPRIF